MARRLRPSTRPYLCEYQQLAWLAWRSEAAVLEFSGTRASRNGYGRAPGMGHSREGWASPWSRQRWRKTTWITS